MVPRLDSSFDERLCGLLNSPHTTPRQLAKATKDWAQQVVQGGSCGQAGEWLASDARLPEAAARTLLDTGAETPSRGYHADVCLELARNPSTSTEILERLRRLKPHSLILTAICEHPNTSSETLAEVVDSIRSGPADFVHRNAESALGAVCEHPNTSDVTLSLIESLTHNRRFQGRDEYGNDGLARRAQSASASPAMRRNSHEAWLREGGRSRQDARVGLMFAASPLTPPEAVKEIVDSYIHLYDGALLPVEVAQFCFVVARNQRARPAAIRKALTYYAETFDGRPEAVIAALADRYRAQAQAACRACATG